MKNQRLHLQPLIKISILIIVRGVAQPGSVSVWGAGGRKFKSCHPDNWNLNVGLYLFLKTDFESKKKKRKRHQWCLFLFLTKKSRFKRDKILTDIF